MMAQGGSNSNFKVPLVVLGKVLDSQETEPPYSPLEPSQSFEEQQLIGPVKASTGKRQSIQVMVEVADTE